jgi:hypothetical protein
LKVVASFYKGLFGYEDRGNFCLEENSWDLDDLISRKEIENLEVPFWGNFCLEENSCFIRSIGR